jgi:hypothetical protein
MASDLAIGPMDPETQKLVEKICRRIGVRWPNSRPGSWFSRATRKSMPSSSEADLTMISIFNVASMSAFVDYAAGLEGLSGPDAMTKTSFRNLPWWLQSYWLPVEFDPPRNLASDPDDPLFVGSAIRLRQELAKIKSMSPFDVAVIPAGYLEMRKDYRSWFHGSSDDGEPLSPEDGICWIWNAFNEAARLSIERSIPIMLCP